MKSVVRSCALLLALSAVLLRGLLPAGWMPNVGGAPSLVICTIDGLRHIHLPGEPAHKSQHESICPFGAAPPLTAVDAPLMSLAPSFAFVHIAKPEQTNAFARPPDYGVHAARAPPVLI